MRVLAGDIGGTNARLALVEAGAGPARVLARRRCDSPRYASLSEVLREFLADPPVAAAGPPAAACLALAGPVRAGGADQTVRITNLPWEVSAAALRDEFGFERLRLINDFQAVGYGIEGLREEDMVTLQDAAAEPRAVRAVIGAGTGLGQAMLVWQDGGYEALATEGGHVDFAPTDEQQLDLWRFLRARHERVGYERILCGSGLALLYEFLGGTMPIPAEGDRAAVVSAAGLAGTDPLAVKAIELFVRIYGAQAGNLALSVLATGGVYIAGGIAPRLLEPMRAGFMSAFRAKGRLSYLMSSIPVRVLLDPDAGLLGAARVASRLQSAG